MIGCGLVQNFFSVFLVEWLLNLEIFLSTSYYLFFYLIISN